MLLNYLVDDEVATLAPFSAVSCSRRSNIYPDSKKSRRRGKQEHEVIILKSGLYLPIIDAVLAAIVE